MKSGAVDALAYRIFPDRRTMGATAGADIAAALRDLLIKQPRVRVIFAAAPSQDQMVEQLITEADIDWSRVDAFHMDEYLGIDPSAPQGFGRYLTDRLFSRVPFGSVHLLQSQADDPAEECNRYSKLLGAGPIDIVCLGIGENGHIAFNDPPVADFDDPQLVKVVELDDACRRQQVNDGCFATFDDVPTHALTLTVPALFSGKQLFCVVPGPTKKEAVHALFTGPIATSCPASILRTHPACKLYLDADSASLL